MPKFNVGQKVHVTERTDRFHNKTGVVLRNDRDSLHPYSVEFDGCSTEIYCDGELEAVSETPKVGSKFYVGVIVPGRTFDTLEEAENFAKTRATASEGDTFGVFQAVKAFALSAEPQEVSLA